jgi:hypothetical protein
MQAWWIRKRVEDPPPKDCMPIRNQALNNSRMEIEAGWVVEGRMRLLEANLGYCE